MCIHVRFMCISPWLRMSSSFQMTFLCILKHQTPSTSSACFIHFLTTQKQQTDRNTFHNYSRLPSINDTIRHLYLSILSKLKLLPIYPSYIFVVINNNQNCQTWNFNILATYKTTKISCMHYVIKITYSSHFPWSFKLLSFAEKKYIG